MASEITSGGVKGSVVAGSLAIVHEEDVVSAVTSAMYTWLTRRLETTTDVSPNGNISPSGPPPILLTITWYVVVLMPQLSLGIGSQSI